MISIKYKITEVGFIDKYGKKYFHFKINDVGFIIDLTESILCASFFIDSDSKLFNYIKTKQFIDDLQDRLFENDIYEYASEEIQWIITKDGLYKNTECISYLKSLINSSSNFTYDCYGNLQLTEDIKDFICDMYGLKKTSIIAYLLPYILDNYPEGVFYYIQNKQYSICN